MSVEVREATPEDVAAIVAMLADDELGAARESPGDGTVVGTLQLTVIPGLARTAATRGQIEAVRVASPGRSAGVGGALMNWAIEQARARGCRLVQLTSDAARTRAHAFYERLGFVPSHVGFKLQL